MDFLGDSESLHPERCKRESRPSYRSCRATSARWQILGTLSDRSCRFRRTMQLDGVDIVNVGIKDVGHTDLVRRSDKMTLLADAGVLDRL